MCMICLVSLPFLAMHIADLLSKTIKVTSWRRLTMAARSGGYYGAAFKGERGVTQGDPLSPTLINVVVDAVVRHWLEGLQEAKEEKDAEGGEGHFSAVFYADDGMVGATS